MKVLFVTGNDKKFAAAKVLCAKHGFDVEQIVADIDEIQGEDPEAIVKDKARKAYEIVKKPLVVTDDSWNIVGLNGFPGAYMKSVIHWFSAQNFVDLMQSTTDRTVILHQYLAYIDAEQTVIFQSDLRGRIAEEPRGESEISWRQVAIMDFGGGNKTLAELDNEGALNDLVKDRGDAWDELLEWLKSKAG